MARGSFLVYSNPKSAQFRYQHTYIEIFADQKIHLCGYSEFIYIIQPVISSVQFSCSVMYDSLRPHDLQHTRPPCPSPNPGAYPNSCSLSQWCHPTISSSVVHFSSCPQSFPASASFQMSQLIIKFNFQTVPFISNYWGLRLTVTPRHWNQCRVHWIWVPASHIY